MPSYMLLLVSSAAAIALPTEPEAIVAPKDWFSAIDLSGVSPERSAKTTFEISIDEDGRAVGCEIVLRSGVEAIDKRVCIAVVAKATFVPARDASGDAAPSVIRKRVAWLSTETGNAQWFEEPDYVVEATSVSGRSEPVVSVALSYRESGEIGACHVLKSSSDASLDERACDVARARHPDYPVITIAGDRTPVLRFLNIGFA